MGSNSKVIKKFIKLIGWDCYRLSVASNPNMQLLAALNTVSANLLFDVGANIGQFAQDIRLVGFSGKIISFEPLSSAHKHLSSAASSDPNWLIHSRVAVGDHDGEIDINIAGNSVSSSVLPMLEAHSNAAEGSAYVGSERTEIIRLDTVAEKYLEPNSRPFIKIDTQGFEWQVLDGCAETLKIASGVILEMSLVSLYGGQRLWLDIIERLESEGFTLWAIQKGFTDPQTGRSLQVDGIFLKV